MEDKKHLVLVHGAFHGAWCWYKLVPLLKLAGHRVTALDLGASGVHPKQLHELVSFSDYIQPLMDLMGSLPHGVVLVGHSYGGFALSLAMEKNPEKITVAVFVSSYMPNFIYSPAAQAQEFFKRQSVESLLDCQIMYDQGQGNLPKSISLGSNYLEAVMYKNCLPEDVELAKMVIRPFKFFLEDLAKESLLSEANYGSVDRVFVVCGEDGVMEEEFQQWIITENSPVEEVKFIGGAGHMVMLSKPKELSLCLEEIAQKYF